MTVSDADLVHRVRRGDLDAYTDLISRHRASLERYAMHLLGSREEAEDALQDTLLRAYRAIAQCARPERFRAWVMTILVNRCRTRLGRNDPVLRDQVARIAMETAVAPEGADTSLREEIQRALANLPSDQREAFLLKHVEDMSYEEMAELTDASVPALKMRVHRACERLRVELQDYDHA